MGGPLRRDRTPKGSRWWKRNQRVLQVEEPAGNAASNSIVIVMVIVVVTVQWK